jgi:hypothetical protein
VLSKFTSSSSRLYFSSIEGTLSDTKELNISAQQNQVLKNVLKTHLHK